MQISSVHTTTFCHNCNDFFNSFVYVQKFFTTIFLRKTVAVLCVVCKGRKPCPICAGSFRMGCLIYHCCSFKALAYCNWICKDFGTTTLWKLLSIYKTVEKIVALRKNVVVCMDLNCIVCSFSCSLWGPSFWKCAMNVFVCADRIVFWDLFENMLVSSRYKCSVFTVY